MKCREFILDLYKENDIDYRFFVGLPLIHTLNPNSHNQAARNTPEEIGIIKTLVIERDTYGDVVML